MQGIVILNVNIVELNNLNDSKQFKKKKNLDDTYLNEKKKIFIKI